MNYVACPPCLPAPPQVRQPYMVLLLALVAGDARSVEALTATLAALVG